jgi:RNA polymerase sigma-70 factor (ECF subfamily)
MEDLSEKEIIIKIKNGEIDHFAFLVKRFSQIIYFYTKKKIRDPHDLADIVQNSFIKAYKGLDRFDIKKTFYPYLFTIVKNEIADYYRKKKSNIKLTEQTAAYEQSFQNEKEEFDILLSTLKKDYRTVIELYYLQGFSYNEIAEKVGKPLNTIKTYMSRAKADIKKNYEK